MVDPLRNDFIYGVVVTPLNSCASHRNFAAGWPCHYAAGRRLVAPAHGRGGRVKAGPLGPAEGPRSVLDPTAADGCRVPVAAPQARPFWTVSWVGTWMCLGWVRVLGNGTPARLAGHTSYCPIPLDRTSRRRRLGRLSSPSPPISFIRHSRTRTGMTWLGCWGHSSLIPGSGSAAERRG